MQDDFADVASFVVSSDEDAEEVSSQDTSDAEASGAEPAVSEPPRTQQNGRSQTQNGKDSTFKPGTTTLKRLRKAQQDGPCPAQAAGQAASLADSEPDDRPELASGPRNGQDVYQTFTPEQKGKQRAIEAPLHTDEPGPSRQHEAYTPEPAARRHSRTHRTPASVQFADAHAASNSPGSGPTPKKRCLRKADGQAIKVTQVLDLIWKDVEKWPILACWGALCMFHPVLWCCLDNEHCNLQEEEDDGKASGPMRSTRSRKGKPDYQAMWQAKAVSLVPSHTAAPAHCA